MKWDFQIAKKNRAAGAFTLVEIMIVVAIIGIIITAGIPLMWKAMAKNELSRAVNDVMEGCKAARDRAILDGTPYEFVIREKGDMDVVAAPSLKARPGATGETSSAGRKSQSSGNPMAAFPRKLGENIIVQLIDVNFIDHMNEPEARVHFYPNGTSDEFTIVLNDKGTQRTISLDIVTGLPEEKTK